MSALHTVFENESNRSVRNRTAMSDRKILAIEETSQSGACMLYNLLT